LDRFLAGPGKDHVYMVYVGMGWAMARLPRFRWSTINAPDPLLRWLMLDGYGFHQAYFRTGRYVREQFRDPASPRWAGPYASRAIDQGIGRALWFVGGTDPGLVATMIENFPESRRSDLYSGAGLAATYAGGTDQQELRTLWLRAGQYRPYLAQGCAFGAEARVRAGLAAPHVELATQVFCGMTPEQAADVCAEKLPDEALFDRPEEREGTQPAYEVWRRHVAHAFTGLEKG
jgi:hypothetical protein